MLRYLLETFAENGKNASNLNPVTFITHHRVNIYIIIIVKIFIYQIPIPAQRGLVTFSRSLATRFSWPCRLFLILLVLLVYFPR